MPNDRITYFECQYDLINNTAMGDAEFSSSPVKDFCDIDDLVTENADYNYMTMEHNYSVLDGSLDEFADSFETPYFSSMRSPLTDNTYDEATYEIYQELGFNYPKETDPEDWSNPYLSISFSQPQNCYGITFNFEADYPLEIKISSTDSNGLILHYYFHPNNKYYVADLEVLDITDIDIEFTELMQSRYVKLKSILFGRVMYWDETDIRTGSLLLDTDIISDKISINTLNFDIIDKNNQYNIANKNGLHRYFQKRQNVYTYEWLNGTKYFLGKYFLDNFSWDANLVKLNCVSYIGLLDDVNYNDGDVYNGTKAGILIEDILAKAGITQYTIDTDTYNSLVYGTIKPGTCRQALREILFAVNSTVNSTSEDGIVISKINESILGTVKRNLKISTKIIQNDYTYGVEMDYVTYKLNSTDLQNIVDAQEYPAGVNTVTFNNMYSNVTITADGQTITPIVLKKYYCVFELEDDAAVTITGNAWEETQSSITVTNPYIEAGETPTIKKYNSTLCDAKLATEKAKLLLNYFKYRLTLDIQTLAEDYNMDGRYWIENPNKYQGNFIAWYTSRNFDLTGGFVDTAKLIGYYYSEYDYYYTDNELFAGDNVGVI